MPMKYSWFCTGSQHFLTTKKQQQGRELEVLFNLFSVMSKALMVFPEIWNNLKSITQNLDAHFKNKFLECKCIFKACVRFC